MTCEAFPSKDFTDKRGWLASPDKLAVDTIRNLEAAKAFWDGIIHTYSRCNLTVESDKLIALCGIAKRLGALHGGVYLAGIWSQNLLTGLLWQISKWITGEDRNNVRYDGFIGMFSY